MPGWVDAGCNIDTGLPASIIAQMVLDGRITVRGSFAPDLAVPPDEFFKELKKKGIVVYQDGEAINGLTMTENDNESEKTPNTTVAV